MGNANRIKGDRVEREIRALLRSIGYDVTRSAGSHGAWDLVAIHPTHVRAIQVKAGREPTKVDRESAQEAARSLPPGCSGEIWHRPDGVKEYRVEVF